jgi:XisH protein
MPRLDSYHQLVKSALILEGWTITNDPLVYRLENRKTLIDLGAERLLGAEKGTEKIAVEIKSFLKASPMTDLQEAVGQYMVYQSFIAELEPERKLILAIPSVARGLFEDRLGKRLINSFKISLLVYNIETEVIETWITNF